jgi:hypothetical protein
MRRGQLGIFVVSLLLACSEKTGSDSRDAGAEGDVAAGADLAGVDPERADAAADGASVSCGGMQCPTVRNGVAECVANACRARCPGGTKLCLGSCIFEEEPCSEYLTCPTANPLWCAGQCVKDEPDSCCELQRCGAFACKNNGCLLTCASDADCASGHTCAQGLCGPCGHKGEPCCWDSAEQRYDCAEPMVGCRLGSLKCEAFPQL